MDTELQETVGEPIVFTGRAGSFWGLALLNLLLTIVTLGIYRFWAKTQVRRYLWGNTIYRDDALDYRGRGIELFIGALIAFFVVVLPLSFITLAPLVLRGSGFEWVAPLMTLGLYIGLLYLFGVAIWRAQRYRLSRTAWRGIRGGMRGTGWGYGILYLKLTLFQIVTFGFGSPYVSTRLWNERWSAASFGNAQVAADAPWRPLFKRFVLSWLAGLVVYVVAFTFIFAAVGKVFIQAGKGAPLPREAIPTLFAAYGMIIVAAMVIGLIMLSYYAKLTRTLFDHTRLETLGFRFDATASDWLRYWLGNMALVAVTLGLGTIYLPMRLWGFYVRHLTTVGELDFDHLVQTTLTSPRQGEGLADAFDVSPF